MTFLKNQTSVRKIKERKRTYNPNRPLNARERAFVHNAAGRALTGMSLRDAHRKAGYSPTAIGGPNRLLDQPRIRAAIEELELRKAAEAGVRLGAVLNATVKIAFANLADFVECDEDGNMKINEDGQPQLRPGLTREDLEAVSTITVNDRGKVTWSIDRAPALKALGDLLHPLKTKVELTGADGAPLFDPSKLSDDDLASLIRILEGAITGNSGVGQGGGGSED